MEHRVLITDDDAAFRMTLQEVLTRRGFRTCQASDGLEAIEAIECGNIHLALFDIHMPRLDGLGALERVRQALPQLPCILMSAKLDDGIRARAHQLGAQAVLPKPFSISDLIESISRALVR
ncbi:MAG: response regulator [Planctomycetota bacterium]|jgi:CheY-like chemotaxis protein